MTARVTNSNSMTTAVNNNDRFDNTESPFGSFKLTTDVGYIMHCDRPIEILYILDSQKTRFSDFKNTDKCSPCC